jgi:3D (Asp-Asp-Asp) domain-containing protein
MPVTTDGGLFVAADPAVLPIGKWIIVPGYADGRPVRVLDTGKALRGNRIDVFMTSHEQAKRWGRKVLTILVLPDPPIPMNRDRHATPPQATGR